MAPSHQQARKAQLLWLPHPLRQDLTQQRLQLILQPPHMLLHRCMLMGHLHTRYHHHMVPIQATQPRRQRQPLRHQQQCWAGLSCQLSPSSSDTRIPRLILSFARCTLGPQVRVLFTMAHQAQIDRLLTRSSSDRLPKRPFQTRAPRRSSRSGRQKKTTSPSNYEAKA